MRDEESPTCLLNMHRRNGTGRGRDKGRLIFPAFRFVPSLFYFGANCYRYRETLVVCSTFLPLSLSPSHPFPRRVDTKSLDFDICRSLVIILVKNLFFFIPCNSQFSIFTLPCNHSMTVDVICFEQIKDCFICQLS